MRHETVCGLDIGTTKTCAVVAVDGPNGLEIVGVGEAPSKGMRKGVVVDLDETIKSIEAATEKAERMAGIHVDNVFVGITGDHMRSTNNRAVVAVSGEDREVSPVDVRRVIDASKIINLPADRQIIHALPRFFTVDGQDGVEDPVGMAGGRLEVDTHLITGGSTFITNVLKCVHRAGLEAAGLVFEPLASSIATLMAEEKQVGVVLLDIGGGTTDIAVFSLGSAIYTSTIPVGGNMLTNDISLGLKTTLAEAEDVKKRFGAGVRDADGEETFAVRTLDGRAEKQRSTEDASRSSCRACSKRCAWRPKNRRERSARSCSRRSRPDGRRRAAAEHRSHRRRRLRIAGARRHAGRWAVLTDAMTQPQYATAIGLVLFGANGEHDDADAARRRGGSILHRIRTWLADLWN